MPGRDRIDEVTVAATSDQPQRVVARTERESGFSLLRSALLINLVMRFPGKVERLAAM